MSRRVRIISDGVSRGTRVLFVGDDGTEVDVSEFVEAVEWTCSARDPRETLARAVITTRPGVQLDALAVVDS